MAVPGMLGEKLMQHDHHCRLTFHGFNWWITECKKNRIRVMRIDTRSGWFEESWVDTIDVDWETYAEAALAWDRRRTELQPYASDLAALEGKSFSERPRCPGRRE